MKEIQIKFTMRYFYTTTSIAKIKKKITTPRISEDVEELES